MTKSTITDERITSVIERLEHFASNLKWTDVRGAQDLLTAADGLRELQERRKADREPVGYFGRFDPDDEDLIDQCSKNVKGAFPLYRHAQPAPVMPVVPDDKNRRLFEKWWSDTMNTEVMDLHRFSGGGYACHETNRGWMAWNACRAAMLQAGDTVRDLSTPVDPQVAEYEQNVMQAGNSPVIPDGYVMVPKEPTDEMQSAGASAIRIETTALNKLWTGNAVFRAMLAAAPQEVSHD